MKYFASIKLMLVVTFLCAALLVNAQTNEGVFKLTTTNTETGEEAHVEWLMKDGNHKMVINGSANGQATSYILLFLKGNPNGYMLSEVGGEKALFTIPASAFSKSGIAGNLAVKVDKSTYTVNGYETQKVTIEGDNQTITMWVTTDLPISLDAMPPVINKSNMLGLLQSNHVNGIPVKVVARDSNGAILYTQNIESFTAISVSSTEFDISGYTDGAELIKNAIQK